MCGRIAKYASSAGRAAMRAEDWRSIREEWRPRMSGDNSAPRAGDLRRDRFNIPPSATIEVIRKHPETGAYVADPLVWGLIPRWTKDLKGARKPSNARSEGVRTSGMFKDCFARRRCLVPVDAFYEWHGDKPPKQPHAFARRDGHEMLMAAIWDGWKNPEGEIVRTVCLLTTGPNATMAPIHDRMPVLIQSDAIEAWCGEDADAAASLLGPAPDAYLRRWPVSKAVNDVRNDGPELLAPIDLPGTADE